MIVVRRLLFALPVLAFAAVSAYFAVGLTRDPQRIPSALLDRPMPDFALPPIQGVGVPGLADETMRGEVALLNIFASWCGPCRIEHPILMRLAEEKRVPLYGIGYKDKAEDSRKFLAELGNPYLAAGHDLDGRVGIEWGVTGVPETFVVDRQGRVRYKHVGPLSRDAIENTLMPMIAKLNEASR